jgi:hypothetical protein
MLTSSRLRRDINAVKIGREVLWELSADTEKYQRENPEAEACFEGGSR